MKIFSKLLTSLSSIAAVGVMTPAIVSCGCSNKDFVINYQDDINCFDKKEPNYHSLKDVQNSIRLKAQKHERTVPVTEAALTAINNYWETSTEWEQIFYYDLIASLTITQNRKILLTGWTINSESNKKASFNILGDGLSINISDGTPSLQMELVDVDGEKYVQVWLYWSSNRIARSYMFDNWQAKNI